MRQGFFAVAAALLLLCVAAPVESQSSRRPVWVDRPESVYNRTHFITAVGFGPGRYEAERDALARLVAVFGQSIQAELTTLVTYSETVRKGVTQMEENTAVQNAIVTLAHMDDLIGAELMDFWHDTRNNIHYAIAVMEREKAAALYANRIYSNEQIIANLVDMNPDKRNSLEGFARFRLAATIADANHLYANVLAVVGNMHGINAALLMRGEDFRLAAVEVASGIPIEIIVSGDPSGRLRSAFSSAITRIGFRVSAATARYALTIVYTVTPVVLAEQQNHFVRYQITAELQDSTQQGSALFTHSSITGRAGHLTLIEAQERALREVERRITADFEPELRTFLDTLLFSERR